MKKVLELEYVFHTSPRILYPRLSTANGLTGWLADKVHQNGPVFTFTWFKISNDAKQSETIENSFVKYNWMDELGYFEFKLNFDEMTGTTDLLIREYTDEDEIETARNLWNSQIAKLKHLIGC